MPALGRPNNGDSSTMIHSGALGGRPPVRGGAVRGLLRQRSYCSAGPNWTFMRGLPVCQIELSSAACSRNHAAATTRLSTRPSSWSKRNSLEPSKLSVYCPRTDDCEAQQFPCSEAGEDRVYRVFLGRLGLRFFFGLPVTPEVASSSLVDPAIFNRGLCPRTPRRPLRWGLRPQAPREILAGAP